MSEPMTIRMLGLEVIDALDAAAHDPGHPHADRLAGLEWWIPVAVADVVMAVLARHAGERILNDEDLPVVPLPDSGDYMRYKLDWELAAFDRMVLRPWVWNMRGDPRVAGLNQQKRAREGYPEEWWAYAICDNPAVADSLAAALQAEGHAQAERFGERCVWLASRGVGGPPPDTSRGPIPPAKELE